ncbi:MAG TPA: prolipoprotein diacylglyceryl transferase family protein [Acidimicrobiia bacterium]|nr:prolipoprotein diacylglyceryl transferase family protein [Acidimicrobiia bacterium]
MIELTLLAAALTAFAAAYLLLRFRGLARRDLDRLWGAALAGMFTGRLAELFAAGINPLTNPGQLLLIRGGVDTTWASLGAVFTLVWPLRHHLHVLDRLAPAVLAALGGWHAGCLWRSTCLGTASDLPWAFPLPGSTVSRHPVELYAALLFAVGAWALSRWSLPTGVPAGLGVAWAAGTRLVTESLRPSLTGGPVAFYVAALIAGLAWSWWSWRQARAPLQH